MNRTDRLRRALPLLGLAIAAALLLAGVTLLVGLLRNWLAAAVAGAVAVVALAAGRWLRRRVPRGTVLEVDLEQGIVEHVAAVPGAKLLTGKALELRDLTDALHRAAGDDRVTALVARVGASKLGLAKAQELRDAVAAFRAGGKRAVAWAEVLGEGGDATIDYYLAAAFDEVYLQPGAWVSTHGVLHRFPFLRGVFDKLGVRVEYDHREEYKAAKYTLTETEVVPPHREVMESLAGEEFDQIVAGIAAGRGLEPDAVRAAIDRAPLLSAEAEQAGLVDGLAYRDEVYDKVKGARGRLLYLDRYLKRAGRPHRKGAKVALVYAVGPVARGESKLTWFPQVGVTMGADTVSKALREATEDDKVKAIVMRVDSPGGSAVASESIWRTVANARRSGKPVVVSMGDVAGSGGYYIACGADKIVAQPGTLTGSIGVVSGKMVTVDALARAGITSGESVRGRHGTWWSAGYDYDEEGWGRLQAFLDDVYVEFRSHVAEGRGMSMDEVTERAKGRVWLGSQAHANGLVDALGGLETAVGLAREAAGLGADADLKLVEYPRRKRRMPWDKPESSEMAAVALQAAAAGLAPLSRSVSAAVPTPERAVMMPADI